MQNPNRFTSVLFPKSATLWTAFAILSILLYSGYQARLTQPKLLASEQFLIEDNLSLERPDLGLFFTDSKTLSYYEGGDPFRPLFVLGLSLDYQFKNPWVLWFHSWLLFILFCGILMSFPYAGVYKTPKHLKCVVIALGLLTLLPSTTAVLENILHRAELSATVFLMVGFWLMLQRYWSAAIPIAILFFIGAGLIHELAWFFLLPLGFYLKRKSFDMVFGIVWCFSFSLGAFWFSTVNPPFAATGFMMSVGLYFIPLPLFQNLSYTLKNRTTSPLKKQLSLSLGLLFMILLNLKYQDVAPQKPSLLKEYRIGKELISNHQWNDALLHFEDLHQKIPYHRQTVLCLMDTYHALERWNALEQLSSHLLAQKHLPEITKGYQDIVASKKPRIVVLEEIFLANPTIQNALPLANEYYRRGEYAQSAHFSRWILQHEPNSEKALHQLGEAYLKLGNLHDAKRSFQKASGLTHTEHNTLAVVP
ncbi:MAG: hypothetical protein AAGL34_06085 [Bacteroidota bacterium]